MNTIAVLLVIFILDGEAHTFAVQAKSPADCIVMESKVGDVLPGLIGRKPEAYAAKCADLKPFLRAS